MQILLVSATEQEIAPFLAKNILVDHLITGVGAPACLYFLLKKIQKKNYDLVIQAGIAGTFNPALSLAKTVLVQKDVFADLGEIENNRYITLFDMGLANKNDWPYRQGWLENENIFLEQCKLEKVSAITVNTVTDEVSISSRYKQYYNAGIETMEGAALHYICLQEKINFLQLRSISNVVGERDKTKWKLKEAIENLNAELAGLIKELMANS